MVQDYEEDIECVVCYGICKDCTQKIYEYQDGKCPMCRSMWNDVLGI